MSNIINLPAKRRTILFKNVIFTYLLYSILLNWPRLNFNSNLNSDHECATQKQKGNYFPHPGFKLGPLEPIASALPMSKADPNFTYFLLSANKYFFLTVNLKNAFFRT